MSDKWCTECEHLGTGEGLCTSCVDDKNFEPKGDRRTRMTREEAIEKLELMRQKVDEETYRALILAIKALEQEPCENKSIMNDTELDKAIRHIKTRADAWAVKEVTDALQSISKRLDKALSQDTCEDAISIPKYALKTRVGNIVAYNVEWLKKHWQMEMDIVCGVKPCEDAISREAVVDDFVEWREKLEYMAGEDYSGVHLLNDAIQKIWDKPSVTQKSKTGHWILTDDDFVYCSECEDSYYPRPIDASWYYCPHCGAKMVEPQESEETETWNGIHGQITAPKGTFKKIWEEAESEDKE